MRHDRLRAALKGRTTTVVAGLAFLAAAAMLHAQGRGNTEWTTDGFDAQRSGWVRADARLTKEAVGNGELRFLWKMPFENAARQLNSLTPPVLLDRLIGYRGFKSLAFVGATGDRIYSVDTDLARPYWTAVLTYTAATAGQPPPTADCPGGLVAMPARRTALAPASPGGGGGRAGVRNGSAVGEPGKGAAVLSQMQPQRGSGRGDGRGREGGGVQQGRGLPGGAGGLAGRGAGFGGVEPLVAMGTDGYLRALYVSNGGEMEPPFPFVPPDAKPSSLLFVDATVYTTTAGECGAAPNAVWAVDVSVPQAERKVRSWQTGGPDIVGPAGLALGTDGSLFVALGKAPKRGPAPAHAESVVALDRQTLQPKDWFTAPGAGFNATPIVIRHGDRDLVAVTADDGRLYVLDARSPGGADRRSPLAVSGRFGASGGGLATFEDGGTRWILATARATGGDVTFPANGPAPTGRVVAFKLTDAGGAIAITPGWQSRDLTSPLAPIVVGGVVFAVSSGEYRGGPASLSAAARARRSLPAVLYALDGATGKTIWSSGTRITSFARAGLAAGGGQVYVVTYDNHLYAFGIPMEH